MRLCTSNAYIKRRKPGVIICCITTILILESFLRVCAQSPTVTAFSPATVCQGGTVTITGTNFTGATNVRLGNAIATNLTVISATSLTATVANQSVSGTVSVTTPAGTVTASGTLTILPAPVPVLTDISTRDAPFTNCDGSVTYQLRVTNSSTVIPGNNNFEINWGDGSPPFTLANWVAGAQTTHTYNSQGYFNIVLTITPVNGCTRSVTYNFYNGRNPLAGLTTTNPTTGLCVPAPVEFQISNWFNNSAGTSYQLDYGDGSPRVTLPHPLNSTNTIELISHTYTTSSCPNVDFKATLNAINGCFTTAYTLNQIIIRKKPVADFRTLPAPACIGVPVCFTNMTTNGFSGNTCSTTSTYLWDFGDGTTSTLQNPPCHTYATAGTYQVTLTASNIACGSDVITKPVIVTAPSPPPVVSATPVTYCRGQAAVPLTATGTALLWYTSPTGGTGSSVAPTPSTNTAGNITYYVSQTIPNNCESPRVPVTVTIVATPAAPPVITPVQLCQNQAAVPLTASGTGLLWYSNATGGTGTATPPIPSTGSLGNTTYYVSQTTNGCEGPRASIVVTVNSVAGTPVVRSPVTYCQNQTAAPLTATGTGLMWYTSATSGTGSTTAPTPSTTSPGSTTYYVSQVTGCGEGPRASIIVNVNAGPSAVIAYGNTNLCNVTDNASTPNPPVAVILTGTAGGSFSILPSTGLPINAVTGTLTPSGAVAGTYTVRYTVSGTGGCSNFTTTTAVTVSGSPAATITYPALCTSDPATSVNITGARGGSFTSSSATLTIDQSTGTITPATSTPGTYTVTYTILPAAPCPGFSTSTSVTVATPPSASITYLPNLCNVADNASTPNPPVPVALRGMAGGSFSISPSTGLPIDAVTGTLTPSGAAARTYTIRYTVAGTGSCSNFSTTATVTVSGSPTATLAYPPICTSDAITKANISGATGGLFTSSPGLTIDPSTGAITPPSSTPGTYAVTYTISALPPCPGLTVITNVTITQAPAASISYNPMSFCNVADNASSPNPPVTVTLAGTMGGNFSISPTTGLSIDPATGTLTPSGATAGTYVVRYSVPGTGSCANYSTTAAVVVSGASAATISYSSAAYCRGINTPQQVLLTGTRGGTFSSSQGLSLNAATGEINPALSSPGIYTVTYSITGTPPCPGYTARAVVEITNAPAITFPAAVQSVCSGGTAVFVPSSTLPNTTYQWAVAGSLPANVSGTTSGTSSGSNPAISLSFVNAGTVSQSIKIRVTPANPSQTACSGAPYDLTLIVNPVPAALAPATVDVCMGSPAVPLTANASPGNTISWYDENFVLLSGAPVISTATAGLYNYYIGQSNNSGCESPRSKIAAVVHPTAKIISSTFANPASCGIASGSITLNVLDLNDNAIPNLSVFVHYEKFQTAYKSLSTTDASGKITVPLVAGTYTNIYVETSGCISQKIPDIFILKDPNPPAQPVAGYNPPICSEAPLILTALSAASSQAGPVDYVWSGPAFGPLADTFRSSVINFPSAKVSDAGTYVVYAIQNNCISPATNFQVVVKQSPSRPRIITRTPLCLGEDLTLQATSSIPGSDPTLNYLWKGPGTGFPVNAPNAAISKARIQDAGIYSITVTSPQTGCSATADTLIQIGAPPIVKFAQDTLNLPTGFQLNLLPVITNATEPNILPIRKYEWIPSQAIVCADAMCSAATTTIKNNACFTVKATNIYGCSGSDVVCVKVFCQGSQIFIPNAFTPRGDVPENTKLMVRASGISSVRSFRVFNRWGKIVFERNNFPPNSSDFGWGGRVNGKLADPGVYVYTADVICENGIPYTYKGNVTLL